MQGHFHALPLKKNTHQNCPVFIMNHLFNNDQRNDLFPQKQPTEKTVTSSTAFSLALSDSLSALISACASPNSLSLSAKTTTTTKSEQNHQKIKPKREAKDRTTFRPLTSFSRRLNSNFTGSDPCSKLINSSVSKFGFNDGRRFSAVADDDDDLPSPLNDANTVSDGVALPSILPLKSAISDLNRTISHQRAS